MAAGAAAAGCSGSVIVEDGDGAGGSGGGATGSVTVATTGSTTGSGFVCNAQPDPWTTLEYVCLPLAAPCPAANDPAVEIEASKIAWQHCESCCNAGVFEVPCGPDPQGAGCCYVVEFGDFGCEGRPFTVGGASVTAALFVRADWKAGLAVDATALDDRTRRTLAAAWTKSALAEHASVASFARFTLELLALGAPADLVRDAQRAMGDEIEHARMCFGVASALGGEPLGPSELSVDGSVARIDPVRVAVATLVEGCVGETLSAALAIAERDAAADPVVRTVLDTIAEDESAHAELAWRSLGWMMRRYGAPVREAVARALQRAKPFEVDPAALAGVPPHVARAFGRLPAREAERVLAAAFDEIVLPCADALEAPAPVSISQGTA